MRRVVVALGNFDGVHLGHQAVLRRAVEEGRRREVRVVATT
ncbi:MAG: adenylyltransferase/cytidyltransferase family protein, partial [Actinomycetota bacterium]|nr:adenylyltransferase/cytidyltransferase family protein [Actinomycetota bacterium]